MFKIQIWQQATLLIRYKRIYFDGLQFPCSQQITRERLAERCSIVHRNGAGQTPDLPLSLLSWRALKLNSDSICNSTALPWIQNYLFLYILFTNPSAQAGYDTRSIFKRSLTGFNSEFSFSQTSCLTKAEEPHLPYYLSIAGGRIIGLIPFPRVLVLCEMQSVSSRFWTRVAASIP